MRRFPACCLALLLALLVLPPAHAQVVRDSVKMTRSTYYAEWTYDKTDSFGRTRTYGTCTYGVVALWPDVLKQRGLTGGYGRYSLVSTGGTAADYVPRGNGEMRSMPEYNIFIPDGQIGHNPELAGSNGYMADDGMNYDRCAQGQAWTQAAAGGAWSGPLNARPFRINDWYAVFSLPSGTPLALFAYETGGLSVAFDGSFESKQSREVDATAPGGKRPVASYAWDFGDGKSGSGDRPTHVYADSGRYAVTLTVTDDDGETDTHTRTVKVQKPGLRVWAERTPAERDHVRRTEEVSVSTFVENVSDETIYDVRVPLNHGLLSTFPDSLQDRTKTDPTYKRMSRVGTADTTMASLAPGERAEVVVRYRADTYASYRGPTYAHAVEVEGFATITGVTGRDAQQKPVVVEPKCDDLMRPCGGTWKLGPPPYQIRLALKAAPRDGLAAAEVAAVPAGLTAGPSGVLDVVARHRVRTADLSDRVCRSGCAEVDVEVKDEHGAPVSSMEVRLAADEILPGNGTFGSVTPAQKGRFCDFNTRACGNPLANVVTDARGAAKRAYLVPGVISDVRRDVRAYLFENGLVVAQESRGLTVQPTLVREATIGVNADASEALVAALGVRGVSALADLPATFCKAAGTFLGTTATTLAPRLTQLPYLNGVSPRALDWACSKLPNHLFAEVLAQGKPMAELVPLTWLLNSLQLPATGLAVVDLDVKPPFVKVNDDFTPAVSDALLALATPGLARRFPYRALEGPIEVKIYEVSYMTDARTDAAQTEVSTYGLYLVIGPTAKLVQAGYDGRTWLQEEALPSNVLPASGNAGDDRLALAAPRAPGGEPADEALRAEASAAGSGVVTLAAGDLVVLGARTPRAEVVQVRAVEGTVARLTTPLRFSHADGDSAYVVGRRPADVPPPPTGFAPGDSAAAGVRPLLRWTALVPATGYAVQIARDTTFAALVQEHPALRADTLRLSGLVEGERYAWRVRASNLVGEGAWSRPATFVAATPVAAEKAPTPLAAVALGAPYPNPSRGPVAVPFELPSAGEVRLTVHDALGREVAVLADGPRAAGRHAAAVAPGAFPAGVYFVRLAAGGAVSTRPLVVVR